MRKLLLALASVALPLTAVSAQTTLISPTGVGPWTFTCTVINSVGQPACPANGNAFIVNPGASDWAATPTVNNASYISASTSGTLFPEGTGTTARYRYTFSTVFNVLPGNVANSMRLNFTELRFDNYLFGYSVNSVNYGLLGITPAPLPEPGTNWTTLFTGGASLNAGNIVAGNNTLTFTLEGNGRTDGFLYAGNVSVVPEPASVILMASGLAGLVVIGRRRRA